MKLHCIICKKEFIHYEDDVKRIVNIVDKNSLGTTAILDMATPLLGICNKETDDYHVIDFDQDDVEELHNLGARYKEIWSMSQSYINTSLHQELKNILDRCEELTYSRRIELWQIED